MRMNHVTRLRVVPLAVLAAAPAHAVQPDEMLPDPAHRSAGARICRANCAAWCARTSRSTIPTRRWRATCALLVRERIAAGDSDTQVIDFLVARYGEFVLLKPRLNRTRCCCGWCRRWCCSEVVSCCGAIAGGGGFRRGDTDNPPPN